MFSKPTVGRKDGQCNLNGTLRSQESIFLREHLDSTFISILLKIISICTHLYVYGTTQKINSFYCQYTILYCIINKSGMRGNYLGSSMQKPYDDIIMSTIHKLTHISSKIKTTTKVH